MDSVVCYLWQGERKYTAEHINILARAVNYWSPSLKFVCITDHPGPFDCLVTVHPLPAASHSLASLPAPQGKGFPSSYRRLWLFSDAAKAIGDRILLLDVDALVLGDLLPLADIDADFVGWRPKASWGRADRIGGGTWLLKTGTVSWLWDEFAADPHKLINKAKAEGWHGSDQAILSMLLQDYPVWLDNCGIYNSGEGVLQWDMPPKDAKIVHFNGANKPWSQHKMWIQAYLNHFGRNDL